MLLSNLGLTGTILIDHVLIASVKTCLLSFIT